MMRNLLLGGASGTPAFATASSDWEKSSSQYGSRTMAAGARKRWTFSTWFKLETVGAIHSLFRAGIDGDNGSGIFITSTNHAAFFDFRGSSYDSRVSDIDEIKVDTWYHLVVSYDTDQVTAEDRVRLYLNGHKSQLNFFEFETYPSQGYSNGLLNDARAHYLSRRPDTNAEHFDGLMYRTYFIDDQALTASDFGQLIAGSWQPKDYIGTFGTNGFFLTYGNPADLLRDESGEDNNFTPSGGPTQSTDIMKIAPKGWSSVVSVVTSANFDNGGFAGFTVVQRIQSPLLGYSGTQIRAVFVARNSLGDHVIGNTSVGHAAASGDVYDGDAAPTEVLWGASASTTITVKTTKVTDAATFTLDTAKDLLYAIKSNTPGQFLSFNAAGSDFTWYNRAATSEVDTQDRTTGYSVQGNSTIIKRVEVFNA